MTIVVLGDALLDVDWVGSATRLCPDAPAPVLDVDHEHARPGGAALAAAIAASVASPVVLAAPLPDGPEARLLADLLDRDGVQLVRLPGTGAVPVKRRLLAGGHCLARVDSGSVAPLPGSYEVVRRLVSRASAVLVSDYGRGVSADPEVRAALGRVDGPLVWDPHPRGAAPLPGTTVVTPNRDEARTWARRLSTQGREEDGLGQAVADAEALAREWEVDVVVTLGDHGALHHPAAGPPSLVDVPPASGAVDVCGAGDSYAASLAVALAQGADVSCAVRTAAAAAARFVSAGGAGRWPHAAVDLTDRHTLEEATA